MKIQSKFSEAPASWQPQQQFGLQRLSHRLGWKLARPAMLLGASCLLTPRNAEAHIKWFCHYDTTIPPVPLADMLTPIFVLVAACFGTLMFLSYIIDGVVERNGWLRPFERLLLRGEPSISALIRASVGVFFIILWIDGGTILTPELKTTAAWASWLQLVIAVSMLWRPMLVVAGIGIAVLYAYGVALYGAFHMLDYPIFLGIAAYLGLSATENEFLARIRLPMLYFNLALTMMWGAIEKFGYPYWTFPLLADHKALAMGLSFNLFMVVAGFVEISLAFFMLTGTALLRLACLALFVIMGSAIPEFGKIDAIGHSLILVTLLVMIIAGQNAIQMPDVIRNRGVLANSSLLTLAYGATIASLLVLYHTAQYAAGR